jgi:hypothetical protein
MKIYMLTELNDEGERDEFIEKDGRKHKIGELDEEEMEIYQNAERVELAGSVDLRRRSDDVQPLHVVASYIQIFADGSIFDEYEGSFSPVRIVE